MLRIEYLVTSLSKKLIKYFSINSISFSIFSIFSTKEIFLEFKFNCIFNFIEEFIKSPRIAEVYNIGGGKNNTCSILEAFDLISKISGIEMKYKYDEINRIGDHICYYSNLSKMKNHYPKWDITITLEDTFVEIYNNWKERK